MINFSQHEYLISASILFFISFIAYIFSPANTRKFMTISGLTLIPFSIIAVIFQKSYWNVKRILNFSFGIEDMICTFAMCSFVAFLGAVLFKIKINENIDKTIFFKRFSVVTTAVIIFLFVQLFLGVDVMTSLIIIQWVVTTVFYITNPNTIILSLGTSIAYSAFYILMLKFFYFLFPSFKTYWSGYDLRYFNIIGVPAEEIMWVITFTPAWLLLMMYYLDVLDYNIPD